MQHLQLLRGYAVVNVHMTAHHICATFYPSSRFKKIFKMHISTKTKNHTPTLAPLLSLLVQCRLTPTQAFTPGAYAEMTRPCK